MRICREFKIVAVEHDPESHESRVGPVNSIPFNSEEQAIEWIEDEDLSCGREFLIVPSIRCERDYEQEES